MRLTFGDGVVLLVFLGLLHGRRIELALKGSSFLGCNQIGSPVVARGEKAKGIQEKTAAVT